MVEKYGASGIGTLLAQAKNGVPRTGSIRMIVNGSADWGYSRPSCSRLG
jgi:hypothetical protein